MCLKDTNGRVLIFKLCTEMFCMHALKEFGLYLLCHYIRELCSIERLVRVTCLYVRDDIGCAR